MSNETWDVVPGESHGESGGERKWDFKYEPAVQTKPYHADITTSIQLDGTSTFTESLSGFYSDSYTGEESCRETQVDNETVYVWDLVSGTGGGNGENKFSNKNSLDAELSYKIGSDMFVIPNPNPPYIPTYEYNYYYATGLVSPSANRWISRQGSLTAALINICRKEKWRSMS